MVEFCVVYGHQQGVAGPRMRPFTTPLCTVRDEINALRAVLDASGIAVPTTPTRDTPTKASPARGSPKKIPKVLSELRNPCLATIFLACGRDEDASPWQFVENDGADDEYAFYDMDTSALVRPSELLIGR